MKRIDILYDSSNEGRGKVAPGALPRVQGNTDDGSGFKMCIRDRVYADG